MSENTGSILRQEQWATRDAPPGKCQRISDSGDYPTCQVGEFGAGTRRAAADTERASVEHANSRRVSRLHVEPPIIQLERRVVVRGLRRERIEKTRLQFGSVSQPGR